MKYSPSTGGFYIIGVNKVIPPDVVEITKTYWQELLTGQEAGMQIVADAMGYPVLAPPPPPTDVALAKAIRHDRNYLLAASDFIVLEDVPVMPTTLGEFIAYRQALRDVPQQPMFPTSVTWPVVPVYQKIF